MFSHPKIQRFIAALERFSQQGAVIPRNQGIVWDIAAFLISAVSSLFPGWNPNHLPPIPQQPAAANGVNPQANNNNNNNNNLPDGH